MGEPRAPSRLDMLRVAAMGAAAWLAPGGLPGEGLAPRGRFDREITIVERIRLAAASDPMNVQRLRGGLSVVLGSGGNVAVLPGADGTLLVDSGIVGQRVRASVATVSDVPIRHVINTHWHFDHTDANAWMHARGASIMAHENTRKHLSEVTRVVDWDFTFPRAAAGAIPTSVFTSERSLELNGSPIVLRYYGPAHTDSDIAVHFPDADVLHVADTWRNGIYPFIDYSTGGSIDGTIRATEANLAAVSAKMIIIPGHGPVGGRSQLTGYRDMLVTVRDRVVVLKRQGRSEADVIAAKPTAAFDAVWGRAIIDPALFTRLVYQGMRGTVCRHRRRPGHRGRGTGAAWSGRTTRRARPA